MHLPDVDRRLSLTELPREEWEEIDGLVWPRQAQRPLGIPRGDRLWKSGPHAGERIGGE